MKVIRYQRQENGTVQHIETVEVQEDTQVTEEIIANKEAQLLEMYAELEALKAQSTEK